MLHRVATLAIAAPRRVLVVAALVMVAAAVFGAPVAKSLSAGGFQDPSAESSRATGLLADKFGRGEVQLLFMVTAPGGVHGAAARAAGMDIVNRIKGGRYAVDVVSPWTAPPQAVADLVSKDGRSGLVVAGIVGGEKEGPARAQALADGVAQSVLPRHRDVTVLAGGPGMVYSQINSQTERDLLVMESIALPVSFVVLVWVFGGLLAAALPVMVGGLAIVSSLSVLRLIATTTDVSIFALSLSSALGLALAIDYTLLIVSRYRDEIAEGAELDQALIQTMQTAGRTVMFSATTVALSIAAMVLFPMYFLKSFAYAGVATVALCALAALIVTPAAIVLLGPRLDALDVRRGIRRLQHRDEPPGRPVTQFFWYRWAKSVMRRSMVIGLAGSAVLLVLGLPFLGIKWGFPDDRVLPGSSSARQVGDRVREGFTDNSATAVTIVLPDARGLTPADVERYAARLSGVADVSSVSAPTGTFAAGNKIGPPTAPAGASDGSAFLTVGSNVPLFSTLSETQLDHLREVGAPDGRAVELTGLAQINRDSVDAVTSRLPLVLIVIAAVTLVLLFLLTGSVVLPVKAVILNVLSLTAAFGALVWIFQDGHLGALGTTPTGTLVANMPVLLFCIAFGLSMDYEVFLISRIREFWLASERTRADNDESVALGVAYTGRVVTTAALVMLISFTALIAAQVSFMRMFGVGLTLAVFVDATLVRMILVPACMHILGRWNWWAPAPLARLHRRIGISESVSRA
ncbi:MMPL family transporter [Mycobacterium cookii]|uniref:Membrane protein n=1 Tax=Mycobacterium cookii TaxID=1775 RepID=A0A7I7L586_9MYCO|nr:MMPL family transporter [Mycobacterium cookii]MCV7329406.1 MMPL family transporter [Mycobacterium cookii]BBX48762.1 membrane protein [Mycobacterium cookii]